MHQRVMFAPEPQTASAARRWVRDRLLATGHAARVECAVLATSEVTTNAILHAHTTITVSVDIERQGVRIEVADDAGSRPVSRPAPVPDGPEIDTPSVGNGLHILAAITEQWGVRDTDGVGKSVWFIPATDDDADDTAHAPVTTASDSVPPTDTVAITAVDAPVDLLWSATMRFRDACRELQLLGLHSGVDDSAPRRLIDLSNRVELFSPGIGAGGTLDDDHRNRIPVRTLVFAIPRVFGQQAQLAADLLDEVDEYCRAERLLTLPATADEAHMRRWLLTEFHRQTLGESPRPYVRPEA